jgi:DedD protein
MDRRFKERLVGAIVLVGAAIVILPAVLNGPRPPSPEPAAEPTGDAGLRSERIELDASAATPPAIPTASPPAPATDTPAEEPAAPAKGPAPAPAASAQVATEPAAAPEPTTPAHEPAAPTREPTTSAHASPAAPARTAPAPAKPAVKPEPEHPAVAPATGWAVQVGNFANQSNADALAASLKARGYEAFISPRVSGDKTYFRVRVGPTADVDSARALEQRLKKDVQETAVVPLP